MNRPVSRPNKCLPTTKLAKRSFFPRLHPSKRSFLNFKKRGKDAKNHSSTSASSDPTQPTRALTLDEALRANQQQETEDVVGNEEPRLTAEQFWKKFSTRNFDHSPITNPNIDPSFLAPSPARRINIILNLISLENFLNKSPFTTELSLVHELTKETPTDKRASNAFIALYSNFLSQTITPDNKPSIYKISDDIVYTPSRAHEQSRLGLVSKPQQLESHHTQTSVFGGTYRPLDSQDSDSEDVHMLDRDLDEPDARQGKLQSTPTPTAVPLAKFIPTTPEETDEVITYTSTHLARVIEEVWPEVAYLETRLKQEVQKLKFLHIHEYIYSFQPLPTPQNLRPSPKMPAMTAETTIFLQDLTESQLRVMILSPTPQQRHEVDILQASIDFHIKPHPSKAGQYLPNDIIAEYLPFTPYRKLFPRFISNLLTGPLGNLVDAPKDKNGVVDLNKSYSAQLNSLQKWNKFYSGHLAFHHALLNNDLQSELLSGKKDGESSVESIYSDHIVPQLFNTFKSIQSDAPLLLSHLKSNIFINPLQDSVSTRPNLNNKQVPPSTKTNLPQDSNNNNNNNKDTDTNPNSIPPNNRPPSQSSSLSLSSFQPTPHSLAQIHEHLIKLRNEYDAVKNSQYLYNLAKDCIQSMSYKKLFGEFKAFQSDPLFHTAFAVSTTSTSLQKLPQFSPPQLPPNQFNTCLEYTKDQCAKLSALSSRLSEFITKQDDGLNIISRRKTAKVGQSQAQISTNGDQGDDNGGNGGNSGNDGNDKNNVDHWEDPTNVNKYAKLKDKTPLTRTLLQLGTYRYPNTYSDMQWQFHTFCEQQQQQRQRQVTKSRALWWLKRLTKLGLDKEQQQQQQQTGANTTTTTSSINIVSLNSPIKEIAPSFPYEEFVKEGQILSVMAKYHEIIRMVFEERQRRVNNWYQRQQFFLSTDQAQQLNNVIIGSSRYPDKPLIHLVDVHLVDLSPDIASSSRMIIETPSKMTALQKLREDDLGLLEQWCVQTKFEEIILQVYDTPLDAAPYRFPHFQDILDLMRGFRTAGKDYQVDQDNTQKYIVLDDKLGFKQNVSNSKSGGLRDIIFTDPTTTPSQRIPPQDQPNTNVTTPQGPAIQNTHKSTSQSSSPSQPIHHLLQSSQHPVHPSSSSPQPPFLPPQQQHTEQPQPRSTDRIFAAAQQLQQNEMRQKQRLDSHLREQQLRQSISEHKLD